MKGSDRVYTVLNLIRRKCCQSTPLVVCPGLQSAHLCCCSVAICMWTR